jgi:hypothetical protein
LEVAPKGTKMREAKTPFLHDEGKHGPSRDPTQVKGVRCVWCDYVTPPAVPAGSTVGGDGASSSKLLGEVISTGKPPGEVISPGGDDEVRGQLADAAASVLMKNILRSQNGKIRSP